MNKVTEVPGRLHVVSKEGVLAGANEILDDKRGKNQQDINDELYQSQEVAQQAAEQSKYYSQLTTEAIDSMTTEEQEVLAYSQAVVKHGRAITRIAQQLGASYDEESREAEGEYTPGFTFELKEEEEMEALIANPSAAQEGHIYLQLEPEEEEEEE